MKTKIKKIENICEDITSKIDEIKEHISELSEKPCKVPVYNVWENIFEPEQQENP